MYLSFDIGGTKCMAAVFSDEHAIIARKRADTPTSLPEGLKLLASMGQEMCKEGKVKAVGASAGGPLNFRTGVVSPLHMPEWRNVPLKEFFEREFKAPFAVDVDTNTGALAEHMFAGNQGDRLLYVTVSTGLGGGLVVEGEIYRGTNGSHPELGHQAIAYQLPIAGPVVCSCGASDCLEAIVSGSAIRRHYGKTAEHLGLKEWEQVGYNLGQGLRNAAILYAPSTIVLGGGVCIGGGDKLLSKVREVVHTNVQLVPRPQIVLSKLGYDTALWGGLAMALRAERESQS